MTKSPWRPQKKNGFVSSRPFPTFCRVFSLLDKNNMDEIKTLQIDSDTIKKVLKSEFKQITLVADRAFIDACNKILRVSMKTITKHLRNGLSN